MAQAITKHPRTGNHNAGAGICFFHIILTMIIIGLSSYSFSIFLLVVGMYRIVDGEMQSTALLPFYSLTCDKVSDINHVAQFTDVAGSLHALEQCLRLLIEQVEAILAQLCY